MHEDGTLAERFQAAGYDDRFAGKVLRTHQRSGSFPIDVYKAIISAYAGPYA